MKIAIMAITVVYAKAVARARLCSRSLLRMVLTTGLSANAKKKDAKIKVKTCEILPTNLYSNTVATIHKIVLTIVLLVTLTVIFFVSMDTIMAFFRLLCKRLMVCVEYLWAYYRYVVFIYRLLLPSMKS